MVHLRKKRELEDVSSASMSDVAFLLLVFFMVASVFYVKEGLSSTLPKKESKPKLVLRENVYVFKLEGEKVLVENPAIGKKEYANVEEFKKLVSDLQVDKINGKYAMLVSQKGTSVQDMVAVFETVKARGFIRISLKENKGAGK